MGRRQKHEEHENHERWLVSYADFITLLFAFFVVMYSISQVNEGKYRVLSESLVNAFLNQPRANEPVPKGTDSGGARIQSGPSVIRHTLPIRKGAAEQRQQEAKMTNIARDIMKVLAPLVEGGQVRVTQSARGVAVEINASILFASGDAKLEPESTKALTAVGKVLAGIDNGIQVEGYSDNTPISTSQFPSNWELSSARASSVVRLFIDDGVAPSRLVAIGYAENKPVESNSTPEGRARNRRVTIMILSDAKEGVTEIPVGESTPVPVPASTGASAKGGM